MKNLNYYINNSPSLLYCAIYSSNIEIVKMVLNLGSKLDFISKEVLSKCQNQEIIKLIHEKCPKDS